MTENLLTSPSRKYWNLSITVLVFVGLFVISTRTIADLDLWGHLNWGMDYIHNRGILMVDPYSYLTGGYPWINHEWLGDVLFCLAWIAASSTGLIIFKSTIWIIILGLAYLWLLKNNLPPLRAGIMLFLTIPIFSLFYGTIRPHMFSALGYTLLILIVLQVENGKLTWLWALIPLFWFWANTHGAWLGGIGILGIWTAVYLLTHRSRGVWIAVIPPILLCGLVTLINPYGWDLWQFLVTHISEKRLEITEWRPLQVFTLVGGFYLFWIGLWILGLVYTRKHRSMSLAVLLVVTSLLPLAAGRHLLFFIITMLLVGGIYIGDAWNRFMPVPNQERPVNKLIIIVPFIAAVILLIWQKPNFKEIPIAQGPNYPVGITEFLQSSGITGNMAVDFNWGHYVSWYLAPDILVSVDTRREMAYPEDVYQVNLHFLTGTNDWDRLLDEYPTNLVLVHKGSPPANLVSLHPDWELVLADQESLLFARRGTPQSMMIQEQREEFKEVENIYFP